MGMIAIRCLATVMYKVIGESSIEVSDGTQMSMKTCREWWERRKQMQGISRPQGHNLAVILDTNIDFEAMNDHEGGPTLALPVVYFGDKA